MTNRIQRLGGEDWKKANILKAEDLNDSFDVLTDYLMDQYKEAGMNMIRQLMDRSIEYSVGNDWFAEAYTGSFGQNDTVDSASATFETDEYQAQDLGEQPYVIIEADSLDERAFNYNDCTAILISPGRWQVFCTSGTFEEKRAKIMKTMFQPQMGLNDRQENDAISTASNIKRMLTNVSKDVGKKAVFAHVCTKTWASFSDNWDDNEKEYYGRGTGSFLDTSNNYNVSVWSRVYSAESGPSSQIEWECSNSLDGNDVRDGVVDKFGQDTSSNEIDNPTLFEFEFYQKTYNDKDSNNDGSSELLILTSKDISFQFSTKNVGFDHKFYTDYEGGDSNSLGPPTPVPKFESTDEGFYGFLVAHNIPSHIFNFPISKAYLMPYISNWEEGNSIRYRIMNSEGENSGWLPCSQNPVLSKFDQFWNNPDTLQVLLEQKDDNPTDGYPSIKGVALKTYR